MSTNFLFSKVCWQRPAMFCLYTLSNLSCPWFEFSLKVMVMGLNPGYCLKSFISTLLFPKLPGFVKYIFLLCSWTFWFIYARDVHKYTISYFSNLHFFWQKIASGFLAANGVLWLQKRIMKSNVKWVMTDFSNSGIQNVFNFIYMVKGNFCDYLIRQHGP